MHKLIYENREIITKLIKINHKFLNFYLRVEDNHSSF
jgi:hypothetical protein